MHWLIIFVTIFGIVCGHLDENVEGGKCERIRLPLCQDLAYNWTSMPNLMGHTDQKEAAEAMSAFADVLDSGCSSLARFLLCSAFAPLCSREVTGVVSACRGLCDTVLHDCRHRLRELVPAMRLDCSAFQPESSSRLCMRPPDASDFEPAPPPIWADPDRQGGARHDRGDDDRAHAAADERRIELWIGVLAWSSLAAVAAALLTFCAEPARYRYPARPAVWAAACHGAVALAYVVRSAPGARALACSGGALAADGASAPACVAFFAITHYFTLAADAWVAGSGAAWYLTAASEWSTEALERAGAYLHAGAWGWAGAWTAAALALRGAEGGAAATAAGRGAALLAGAGLGAAAGPGLARVGRALGATGARRVWRVAARAGLAAALYMLVAGAGTAVRVWESRGGVVGAGAGVCVGAASWSWVVWLGGGVAAASWSWSGKSIRVWRRALCPPRKPGPVLSVPAVAPLLPPHKRPLPVSIV